MAWTLEDYNNLKAAIATAALKVEYADKKIEYRSLNDMQKTLSMMEKELASELGLNTQRGGRSTAIFDKGL